MKKIFSRSLVLLAFTMISLSCLSQEQPKVPKWHSEKGYWIVESSTSHDHLIRFYNNSNVLLYKEQLSGTRLNTDRVAVRMKLKKALELASLAYEDKKNPEADKAYVARALRN